MVGVALDKEAPWVLFGFDLSRVASLFRIGIHQLLWEPVGGVRAFLEAPIAVSREGIDGLAAYTDWGPSDASPSACRWRAVALPEHLVLERELKQPVGKVRATGLLAMVGYEAVTVDTLVASSGMSVARVMSELSRLEMKGLVVRCPGGYIRV